MLRKVSTKPGEAQFPSSRGGVLSRDAVEALVARHLAIAGAQRPSLKAKKATPHTLRHSTAMALLQHGVDRSVIALWLGHESVETTQIYLHADMGNVNSKLVAARKVLEAVPSMAAEPAPANATAVVPLTWVELLRVLTGIDVSHCAKCGGDVSSRALDRPRAKDTL
jgi:integrase/recombinase XerD